MHRILKIQCLFDIYRTIQDSAKECRNKTSEECSMNDRVLESGSASKCCIQMNGIIISAESGEIIDILLGILVFKFCACSNL